MVDSPSLPMQKLAELAKLELSTAELARYKPHLINLLGLAKEMVSIDTGQTPPAAHPFESTQRLRVDQVTELNRREIYQGIAPHTTEGLYLVPAVIE